MASCSQQILVISGKSDNVELAKRSLVGKSLANKVLNRNVVKDIIVTTWTNYEELHVSDLGLNTYLFCFSDVAHAKEDML